MPTLNETLAETLSSFTTTDKKCAADLKKAVFALQQKNIRIPSEDKLLVEALIVDCFSMYPGLISPTNLKTAEDFIQTLQNQPLEKTSRQTR